VSAAMPETDHRRSVSAFCSVAIGVSVVGEEDRMLKWFAYEHLPEHLKIVSIKFYEIACSLCALVESGPERTVALRKLLESKDAAVRAKLNPGG